MVLSRQWIPTLAILGFAAPVAAQQAMTCNETWTTVPTIRHQGFTELTGQVVLVCSGLPGSTPTPTGQPIPTVDITVSLGAQVTSRILGSGDLTEAVLAIDDPTPGNQTPCLDPINPAAVCQVLGDGGQSFNQSGKFNVFEGLASASTPNTVTFLGVPADPPASGQRTFRVMNIRVDATAAVADEFGLSPISETLSASPSTALQISIPPQNGRHLQ